MVAKKKPRKTPSREVEVEDELPPLKDTLLSDSAFKQYRRLVKTIEENHDLDSYYTECITMHSGRLSPTLIGAAVSPEKLSQAVRQDVSYRSRYVKIRVNLTMQVSALEEALKAMRRHMAVKYRPWVSHLSLKTDRAEYLNRYLSRGTALATRMTTIAKCIDRFVEDIDACHWQMKIAKDCIELTFGKNSGERSL